jgi:glycosyltransferase involved in cell wall biosynthesis
MVVELGEEERSGGAAVFKVSLSVRVGIITFACDAGRSGIGQYLVHLLREFPKIAPETQFELIGHEDEIEAFLPATHNYSLQIVSKRWQSPIMNILWQNLFLPHLCKQRQYDVLFLPAANRRLPYWLPCPSVGTVHDFSSMHIDGKYDPLRDIYIRRVLPFFVQRLTRVIADSECTKRDIVQYAHVSADRITVIPLGIDHDVYYPRAKEESHARICGKYRIRPPYVLYISRIEHPGKNHVRLIRAFAQLKRETDLPHQLVLAGSDWTRAEVVHQAADDIGLGDEIRFTGFVDADDLPYLYCGADLFVFPSLYEGFGMPILEAMACGTPVACANVSSPPEVAGDAAAYFDPADEDAMAHAMGDLLGGSDALSHLGRMGRQRSAEFMWRAFVEQTLTQLGAAAF